MRLKELLVEFKRRSSGWVVVVNTRADKVLIAKRSSNVNNPGLWNFFGGNLDKKESPKQAALRELEEESGLKFNKKDVVKQGRIKTNKRIINYFVIHIDEKVHPELNREHSASKWVSLNKLKNQNLHVPTKYILNHL